MITNIKSHKQKKKYERVIEDIDSMTKIFILSQQSLSFFKQYIPAQEIISILETNKTLLELQRKKFVKELESLNAN
jgi:uroporphyrinogen-III synthase